MNIFDEIRAECAPTILRKQNNFYTHFILFILLFSSLASATTISIDTLDGGSGAVDTIQLDVGGNPTFPIVIIPGTIDGSCSLTEAITAANTDSAVDSCPAGSGDDTLVFNLTGTVNLEISLYEEPLGSFNTLSRNTISTNMTIQGHSSGTILDASLVNNSALTILDPQNVTIADLEILNAGNAAFELGSAINISFLDALLQEPAIITLENLHIHNNEFGGISYIKQFDVVREVKVLVNDSLIENNTSTKGAGIAVNECYLQIAFSDKRLKEDITLLGKSPSGIPTYSFKYKKGLSPYIKNDTRTYSGVMAQDLLKIKPSAVSRGEKGFYQVDYNNIDVRFLLANTDEKAHIVNKIEINSHYTLEVNNSIIRNNHAIDSFGFGGNGGGICNECGHLKVTNSTISGNQADNSGGGVFIAEGAEVIDFNLLDPPTLYFQTLTEFSNSTVTGNTAQIGGGIALQDNVMFDNANLTPELNISHGTIAENISTGPGAEGAGIFVDIGTANINNTVIADNTGGNQCEILVGILSDNISNSSSDTSCTFANENIVSGLLPLTDNGGTAPIGPNGLLGNVTTMPIDFSSPLFNTADDVQCLATDERGISRPQGNGCDIGAFEVGVGILALTKTITTLPPYQNSQSVEYQIVASSSGGGLADITIDDKAKGLTAVTITSVIGSNEDPGDCNIGSTFPCTIADIADGESVTITLTATIN